MPVGDGKMILGEVFPGEDAEILVEAIKADLSGEDEDTIQDLVVYVKQYKQTEEVATGATAVWNSNMGQYLITIPSAYVPASGIFDVCVRGSDIDDVLIRLQVNTADDQLTDIKTVTDGLNALISTVDTVVDGIATALATPANFMADVSSLATSAEIAALSNVAAVGAEKIVPADKYVFDASESTITLVSPYDTITVEQVLSIRNLTKNMLLYDCTMTNRSSISIDAGVITHNYSGTMADADKLMIIVNMA